METDITVVVEAINQINDLLSERHVYIEQYMQRLETFIGFLTALLIIILFVLIRRRGHKKIM